MANDDNSRTELHNNSKHKIPVINRGVTGTFINSEKWIESILFSSAFPLILQRVYYLSVEVF